MPLDPVRRCRFHHRRRTRDAGGGGATLADALAVVTAAARRGALTPLIEHGILAAWLAATAGHTLTSTTASAAVGDPASSVRRRGDIVLFDGKVTDVPYAADADTLVVLLPPEPAPTARPSPWCRCPRPVSQCRREPT